METGYAVESDHRQVAKQTKKKKPGFVKRWMLKTLREAIANDSMEKDRQAKQESDGLNVKLARINNIPLGVSSTLDQQDRAIQFTIYNASGGRIVETRRYDKKTDRNSNGLYIITNEQDFGKEIDKIITMESLRS